MLADFLVKGEEFSDISFQKNSPMRMCVVTRMHFPKEEMIRFVLSPEGTIVPDLAATLPGRGVWLQAERRILKKALEKGILQRTFQQPACLPEGLERIIIEALQKRAADCLGLAVRAGMVIYGFERVRKIVTNGKIGVAVEAIDGSKAERDRLLSGSHCRVISPFSSQELGKILGRESLVHVGVFRGKLAKRLTSESDRLRRIKALEKNFCKVGEE